MQSTRQKQTCQLILHRSLMCRSLHFSEFPIMYVNVSGDYDAVKLKEFADKMQDQFEELKQITRADIVGAPEKRDTGKCRPL